MLAISAMDSVLKHMPTMTIKYIQIPPADPPFVSGPIKPTVERTHPLPSSREYPKIERKLKFLWKGALVMLGMWQIAALCPYPEFLRLAQSVHVLTVVHSRALVLAFVLLRDNHFAGALATTRLHLVGIVGKVGRFAILWSKHGRHDVSSSSSDCGWCEKRGDDEVQETGTLTKRRH
jgi:hypothetical protein